MERYDRKPGSMAVMAPDQLCHSNAEAIVTNVPVILRNLLQTSQIIRNEAIPMFWRCATFTLSCMFFGPKLGRIGDRAFDNLRSVCIIETIYGKTPLKDVEKSICLFRSLPLLHFVEIGLGYRYSIQQILLQKVDGVESEASPCSVHPQDSDGCTLLKLLLRPYVNSDRRFSFRFWLRSSPHTCATRINYIPGDMASCHLLSCRLIFSLAQYFAPPVLPRRQVVVARVGTKALLWKDHRGDRHVRFP